MVKASFFHVNDVLVSFTNPGWLQSLFDTLMGIFDQVGLRKNSVRPWV